MLAVSARASLAALRVALAAAGATTRGAGEAPGRPTRRSRSSASLTPEQAAKVLAKVGDNTITLGDYVAALEHMDQFDRLRYQSPERRKELLNEMINVELLADEATRQGVRQGPASRSRRSARSCATRCSRRRARAPRQPSDHPRGRGAAPTTRPTATEYRDPERRRVSAHRGRRRSGRAAPCSSQAKKARRAPQWGELVRSQVDRPAAKANVPVDLAGDFGMVAPAGRRARRRTPRVPAEVRAAAFEIPQGRRRARAARRQDAATSVLRRAPHAEDRRARAHVRRGRPRPSACKLVQDKLRSARKTSFSSRSASRVPRADRRRRARHGARRPPRRRDRGRAAGRRRGRRSERRVARCRSRLTSFAAAGARRTRGPARLALAVAARGHDASRPSRARSR